MNNNRVNSFIVTSTGKRFYPFAPCIDDIEIEDIAHHLSNICRFTGATKRHYSVGQHSLLVADILRSKGYNAHTQFAGLMHDAAEAYVTDVPTPIKRELLIQGLSYDEFWSFDAFEMNIWKLIVEKFQIEDREGIRKIVKEADMTAFYTEAKHLMGDPPEWRERPGYNVFEETVVPFSDPAQTKFAFLGTFRELNLQRSFG